MIEVKPDAIVSTRGKVTARSEYFVVVSFVSKDDLARTRGDLEKAEKEIKVHAREWYNSRSPAKEEFLKVVVQQELASGVVCYAELEEPLPLFSQVHKTLNAIRREPAGYAYNFIFKSTDLGVLR
ncbi:MAG: hypothetical protein WKF34_07275 [Pyrinomonadaceae bacterium]